MKIESYKVTSNIKKYISEVWITEFNVNDGLPLIDTIIPSGCINIVCNYLDDYYVVHSNNKVKLPNLLITGQLDKASKIEYGNNTKQIEVLLTPVGFLAMFNRGSTIYKNILINASGKLWGMDSLYSNLQHESDLNKIYGIISTMINPI